MSNVVMKVKGVDASGDLVSAGRLRGQGAYASIYYNGAPVSQLIPLGTTYTKVNVFATNGLSANCTADAANDKVTITEAGIYRVSANLNGFSGEMRELWEATLFLNDVEQSQFHSWYDAVNLYHHFQTMAGFIDVTTAGWDLDMRIRHDDSLADRYFFTYNATLVVDYVGET